MLGAFQIQGAPVLNCPGCGTKIADGTSICPSCDYIIDASFISTDVPQASDDEAESGELPPRKQASPRSAVRTASGVRKTQGARARKPDATNSRTADPKAADEDSTNIRSMEEIVRNAPQRPSGGRATTGARGGGARAAATSAPRRAPETGSAPSDINDDPIHDDFSTSSGQIESPEQVLEDFREFVGELGRSDKIAFGGTVTLILSAFLPWKETAEEGDILGLMSLGVIAIMGAIGIIGAISVRVRRLLPNLNVLIPWLTQLGLSVFCVLWCIIFMKVSYDATEVPSPMGNATIMNSSPSFGVFLGLLGALVGLGGTLLGLKEKPAS